MNKAEIDAKSMMPTLGTAVRRYVALAGLALAAGFAFSCASVNDLGQNLAQSSPLIFASALRLIRVLNTVTTKNIVVESPVDSEYCSARQNLQAQLAKHGVKLDPTHGGELPNALPADVVGLAFLDFDHNAIGIGRGLRWSERSGNSILRL
jgi:hypothetical protein